MGRMTKKAEYLFLLSKIKQKKDTIKNIILSIEEEPPTSEQEKQVLENFLLRQEQKLSEMLVELDQLRVKV
jgi:hypothetical protein